jgi:chromate reductase
MNAPEAYIQFTPGLITNDGEITNDETAEFLRNFTEEFHIFIARVRSVLPRNAWSRLHWGLANQVRFYQFL